MTETTKTNQTMQFGLTLTQKILYGVSLMLLSFLVVPLGPVFSGPGGTVLFILFGLILGVITWYVSAGWSFKLELTASAIKVRDGYREIAIPLEKLGMVVRNGRVPLMPTIWLVLRGVDLGREIPEKGVDPRTRELIEAFRKRNPGKKITYVPLPGGYLRSVSGFVGELKRRIPPLTVDERLVGK